MKCALVIPSWRPEEIFSAKTASSQINYWQPIGTLYVASSLINAGHDVEFINGAYLSSHEILSRIKSSRPRAVGLYATAFGWPKAMAAASEIKSIDPSIYVFAGGPYPIARKSDCLRDETARHMDAVVTGEGDITVPELVDKIALGIPPQGVLGVAYRRNGDVIYNGDRPVITDLDNLPFPARHLLGDSGFYIPPPAMYKRKPVAVMITSRGCNRRCLFCFQIDRNRTHGIRYRSMENVMEEIELCLKQGYREIKFLDDTLAADYDRAMMFTEEIHKRKLDFTWFASACVNQVDRPLLKAFKKAGCWAVLFGAESGVQKNLNAIRKGITLNQTRAAVHAAKQAGLKVYTPFLFGIPGETFEDGLKTIEFSLELNPDVANFHAVTPFPGTDLYDDMDKYGTMSKDLSDYTYQGIAFEPHSMGRREIAELRRIAFKRFYARPSFLLRRLASIRSLNDIKASFNGLKSLYWIWHKRDIFERG